MSEITVVDRKGRVVSLGDEANVRGAWISIVMFGSACVLGGAEIPTMHLQGDAGFRYPQLYETRAPLALAIDPCQAGAW